MVAASADERVQKIIQLRDGSFRGRAGRPIMRRAGFCTGGFGGAAAAAAVVDAAAGGAAGAAGGLGSAIFADSCRCAT